MPIRVAINGFGRIGRLVFRAGVADKDIQFVHINDLVEPEDLLMLLKYDSVHGKYEHPLKLEGGKLITLHHTVGLSMEKDPAKLPWGAVQADVVIESTGKFRSKDDNLKHIAAGAKRVILTVPPKDKIDNMIVLGVNDASLKPSDKVVSNASCTTNCVTPMAHILHNAFGIKRALMTTTHAYTNDQRVADLAHDDQRRARAAAQNIIPTTTGAAKSVAEIIPALKGKIDGTAVRVPVPDGSLTDLTCELEKPVTKKDINAVFKAAAEGPMKGIVEYTEDPIVSSDIIGNPHSCVFDAQSTMVLAPGKDEPSTFIKVFGWYDNEWGYSCRVYELIKKLGRLA